MPLSLLVEVTNGEWTWSFSWCLLYSYSDVFLCSASIVHMTVISLDRFLGISKPLKTRNKSRKIVIIKIGFVWFMTTVISSPLALLAILDHSNILQDNVCAINNRYYMIYGSTLSFLIPFVIMAVTYVKTTHLLNKQASQLSQRADNFHNGLRRTMMHRKLGYARTNSYSLTHPNPTNNYLYNSSSHAHRNSEVSNGGCLQVQSSLANHHKTLSACGSGESDKHSLFEATTFTNKWGLEHSELITRSNFHRRSLALRSHFGKLRNQTTTVLMTITGRKTTGSSLASNQLELANEHKATRVLAVVFFCFFLCWTPFFLFNFTLGFCGESCAVAPSWASSLFLWLGYFSSTLNPIIYTIFNRRFRQAFLKILRCQCVRMHSFNDYMYSTYSRTHTFVGEAPSWRESFTNNDNNCRSGLKASAAKRRMAGRSGNRALSIAFPGNELRQEMAALRRRTSLNTRRRESRLSMTGYSLRPLNKRMSSTQIDVLDKASEESSLSSSECNRTLEEPLLTLQSHENKRNYLELTVQSFLDSRRSSEMCYLRKMLQPLDNSPLSRSVSAAILGVGASQQTKCDQTSQANKLLADRCLNEKSKKFRTKSHQPSEKNILDFLEISSSKDNILRQTCGDYKLDSAQTAVVQMDEKKNNEDQQADMIGKSQHKDTCFNRIFSIGDKFTSKETTI